MGFKFGEGVRQRLQVSESDGAYGWKPRRLALGKI